MRLDVGSKLLELKRMGAIEIVKKEPEPEQKKPFAWPVTDEDIFYGLPGEIVKVIEPHTEADPIALHIQLLAFYGSIIGKGAYYEIEANKHFGNIFPVLIGETSKGRKGTSEKHITRLFSTVASEWEERVVSGLSSGEGLMYAVRDEVRKGETVIEEGITDKRLLVIEPEFASVLKVLSREGNTLSAVIRQAWDSGTLRTLVKNSPLKATNSHISLISHVTKEELLRYLTTTEAANGFANRFLWLCVRRSKCLPRGGQIHTVSFEPLLKRLRAAIDFGQSAGRVKPSEEAWLLWERVYPELSEGKPGLLGGVISRAEAQTMRLAMLYALLDCSYVIEAEHLTAGLALWDYCFESARYVFGDTFGNPVADEILNALKNNSDGLSRTDINNHFGRHKKGTEISQALDFLLKSGLVAKEGIQTEGRSVERWIAKKAKEAN